MVQLRWRLGGETIKDFFNLYGIDTSYKSMRRIMTNSIDEFFHWVSLYYSLLGNLMGEDRSDAVEVIDHDDKFDKWLEQYRADQEREMSKLSRSSGRSTGLGREASTAKLGKYATFDD